MSLAKSYANMCMSDPQHTDVQVCRGRILVACGHLPPETLCKTVPLFFQGDKERDIGRVLSATHVCCTLLGEMHVCRWIFGESTSWSEDGSASREETICAEIRARCYYLISSRHPDN